MRLGIDMDETLNDMIAQLIPLYNEKYCDNIRFEQITDYNIYKFLKPECTDIFQEFVDDKFMSNLNIFPGAVDSLSRIAKRHEVYFVTAGDPYTMKARDDWLKRKLHFYSTDMLIVCKHKHLIKYDVLVDDCAQNVIGGNALGILFDKPWNANIHTQNGKTKRIKNFEELESIVKQREKCI